VREQLEHDRVIRLLQAKSKKRYEVEVNIGDERNVSVQAGPATLYPDLVLKSATPPRRVQGIIEVETGESVNNLEAMAQWVHMGRAGVPFYLYVPQQSVDIARRLCEDHQVGIAELWTYMPLGDQVRFAQVYQNPELAEPPQAARPQGRGAARPGEEAEPAPRAAGEKTEVATQGPAGPARRRAKRAAQAGAGPTRPAASPSKRAAATASAGPSRRAAGRAAAKGTAKSRPSRSASPARKGAGTRAAAKTKAARPASAARRSGKIPKAGRPARSSATKKR
jgi:hypothetical protein